MKHFSNPFILSDRYTRTHTCGSKPASRHSPARKAPTPPEWSRADEFEKLAEAYDWLHRSGGKVFTLQLSQAARGRLHGARDPGRALSRRIHREFKRHGLPLPHLAFSLEVTKDDRNELHVHGAILAADIELRLLKKILSSAGGKISGHAGSRQVQVKNFDIHRGGPAGWARYGAKCQARTRRVIQHDRLIYISSEVRGLCKQRWNQRRRSFATA